MPHLLTPFVAVIFLGLYPVQSLAQSPSPAQPTQERIEALEKRLKDLERQQRDIYIQSIQNKRSVNTFLNSSLLLGGFFEAAATNIDGPATDSQISTHSFVMGINLSAEFQNNFRYVSQLLTGLNYPFVNPHNDPRTSTADQRTFQGFNFGALVAQAYLEHNYSDRLNIQVGLGYVPYGNAFQQREFVLFKRRRGPQMLDSGSSSSVGIAHPLWMGLHLNGRLKDEWGYNLYTFSPTTDQGSLGVGGRLWHTPTEPITIGLSYQTANQESTSYNSTGIDLNIEQGKMGLTAEYASNQLAGGDKIATSYYAEPYFTFSERKYLVFAVADYLDNPKNLTTTTTGSLTDPYSRWAYGAGVNWLPVPFTRFRATLLFYDYGNTREFNGQNRNYHSIDLSAGIAF